MSDKPYYIYEFTLDGEQYLGLSNREGPAVSASSVTWIQLVDDLTEEQQLECIPHLPGLYKLLTNPSEKVSKLHRVVHLL